MSKVVPKRDCPKEPPKTQAERALAFAKSIAYAGPCWSELDTDCPDRLPPGHGSWCRRCEALYWVLKDLTGVEMEVLYIVKRELRKRPDGVTLRDIETHPYSSGLPPDEASAAFQSLVDKGYLLIDDRLCLKVKQENQK